MAEKGIFGGTKTKKNARKRKFAKWESKQGAKLVYKACGRRCKIVRLGESRKILTNSWALNMFPTAIRSEHQTWHFHDMIQLVWTLVQYAAKAIVITFFDNNFPIHIPVNGATISQQAGEQKQAIFLDKWLRKRHEWWRPKLGNAR